MTASAESKPANVAAAGAVSLSLLLAGADNALAMDAASMYKQVEPAREQKSRFAGTEAEALKNRTLGKTTTAPARRPRPSLPRGEARGKPAKPAAKPRQEAAKDDAATQAPSPPWRSSAASSPPTPLAVATTTKEKKAAPKTAASGASDADANAADAQKWIDNWKGAERLGGRVHPEARATSAQKWIDDWKAPGASADESTPGARTSAQKWIDDWKTPGAPRRASPPRGTRRLRAEVDRRVEEVSVKLDSTRKRA